MNRGWLLDRMAAWTDQQALVWRDRAFTFGDVVERTQVWQDGLRAYGIGAGDVVSFTGDYSPSACALLLALIEAQATAVPLTGGMNAERARLLDVAEVTCVIHLQDDGLYRVERLREATEHPLHRELFARGAPGLILFSSGSSGAPKAALHDLARLLEKFRTPRHARRTLTFLLLDHIGGLNTLFHTFSNAGTAVTVPDRQPDTVCRVIAQHGVQILPTSPTFLNLLLVSGAWREHDLSTLELVTYGTEVMPEATLKRVREALPHVRLQQTYGLSELGILRSKSREDGSLWMKVGGEGFETRIVDGVLHIKAASAMLGYLNAPSPFDGEGWMNTGDLVEQDGDYIRVLGRRSEIVNVGGQKVHPSEVESVLLELENVTDATVHGVTNALMGHVVAARLTLAEPEPLIELKRRVRHHCSGRLAPFKVPVVVSIAEEPLHSDRFKKARAAR